MIKAIIFDYGNVISRVNNSQFIEEISGASGRVGDELEEFMNARADLLKSYETGLMSSDEFFERFVIHGGLPFDKDRFIKLFTGRFTPIAETHELIGRLKTGYKLGLLSNTNEWDYEYEIKKSEVFGLFDTITVSFQVGAMKPDKKIYIDALIKLGHEPDECVYIDDIREYVEASRRLGIQGIHYTSHESLLAALKRLDCCLHE